MNGSKDCKLKIVHFITQNGICSYIHRCPKKLIFRIDDIYCRIYEINNNLAHQWELEGGAHKRGVWIDIKRLLDAFNIRKSNYWQVDGGVPIFYSRGKKKHGNPMSLSLTSGRWATSWPFHCGPQPNPLLTSRLTLTNTLSICGPLFLLLGIKQLLLTFKLLIFYDFNFWGIRILNKPFFLVFKNWSIFFLIF